MDTEQTYGWDGETYFDNEMTWEQRAAALLKPEGLRLGAYGEPGWYETVNGCRSVWVTDLD